jgi:hypothetical protein
VSRDAKQPMAEPHLEHDAPLLHLVRKLHTGLTLKDLVRRHRWKRKRPSAPAVPTDFTAVLDNNDKPQTKG